MQQPSASRQQQIEDVFHATINLGSQEREIYLAAACLGDAPLANEVERLLAAHDRAGSFMEVAAIDEAARQAPGSQALAAGDFLDQYQILEPLGRGGMGEVYRARDTRLGREVAIKVLPSSLASDECLLRRFQQEARATSALNHQNILIVHDIGESNSIHFIAAELIRGVTLRDRIYETPLTVGEILQIAVQTADAVAAAHEARIVHRDIKPANIMLRDDGVIKILDFGLAKFTEQLIRLEVNAVTRLAPGVSPVNTAQGMVMGTYLYASPEQLQALPIDERTDVWSLGVVIYEMVARDVPFKGSSLKEVETEVLMKEPKPLASLSPAVDELQRITAKALCKNREQRYQTIKEMLVDLKALKDKVDFEDRAGFASDDQELFIGEKYLHYVVKWRISRQASFPVFNWPAFLLPIPWLAYRKMYSYAAMLLVAFLAGGCLLSVLTDDPLGNISLVLFGVGVLMGIWGNTLYRRHVVGKLRDIKQKKLERSQETTEISNTGGTNNAMGLLGLALVAAILFLLPLSLSSARAQNSVRQQEQNADAMGYEAHRVREQANDLYLKVADLKLEFEALEPAQRTPENIQKYVSDQTEQTTQTAAIFRQAAEKFKQASLLLTSGKRKEELDVLAEATLGHAAVCDLIHEQAHVMLKIDSQPFDVTVSQYNEIDQRILVAIQKVSTLYRKAPQIMKGGSTGTTAAPAGSPPLVPSGETVLPAN